MTDPRPALLTDAELDLLLKHHDVPAPTDDLAERIVAEAARTDRVRQPLPAMPPRRVRRPWTRRNLVIGIIAINLFAASAIAAAFGGGGGLARLSAISAHIVHVVREALPHRHHPAPHPPAQPLRRAHYHGHGAAPQPVLHAVPVPRFASPDVGPLVHVVPMRALPMRRLDEGRAFERHPLRPRFALHAGPAAQRGFDRHAFPRRAFRARPDARRSGFAHRRGDPERFAQREFPGDRRGGGQPWRRPDFARHGGGERGPFIGQPGSYRDRGYWGGRPGYGRGGFDRPRGFDRGLGGEPGGRFRDGGPRGFGDGGWRRGGGRDRRGAGFHRPSRRR